MGVLDVFALIVLFTLIASIVLLLVVLGALPGKIARKRNHHQADAINVCGWLGVITMGLLWPLAFIWAYTKPVAAVATASTDSDQGAALIETIRRLEFRLESLNKKQSEQETAKGEKR